MSRTRMATSSALAAARPQANHRLHVVRVGNKLRRVSTVGSHDLKAAGKQFRRPSLFALISPTTCNRVRRVLPDSHCIAYFMRKETKV
jgi:hypothetical protein